MVPSQDGAISPYSRPVLRRYSVALVLTAVSAAGVAAFVWFLSFPLFLLFVPAIFAAQLYGGIGPGIVSASVALGLSLYAFLPPHLRLGDRTLSMAARGHLLPGGASLLPDLEPSEVESRAPPYARK